MSSNSVHVVHVVLVDEKDVQTGLMEKIEAHQKGLLHRAFSVMLYRQSSNQPSSPNQIEVLLQQRALTKYHGGGLWANTCCSHPMPDEPVLSAAYRRIREEIFLNQPEDLALIKLNHAGSFIYRAELDHGLIEHELDHVLVGEYQNNQDYQDDQSSDLPLFNPDEIAQMQWVSLSFLEQELKLLKNLKNLKEVEKGEDHKKYAPWLLQVVEKTLLFLEINLKNTREIEVF